ncbi:uncharacterized protein LOC121642773 [Melanotaenia boesemani]|uniref:uncharacterized protein LOC121642773 n=1 Tax=Melanotaenia boesemani TaxID=1250792 RepID=UPI001C044EDB|nr:uncharacterized protein LOC121642773 [Melanotaenia boesemani]
MPVQLGEPASFTCNLPGTNISRREVYWCKQSQGDTLKLIVKVTRLQQKPSTSKFAPEFSDSGMKVQDETTFIRLIIPRTTEEDEGIYHCAIMDWASDIRWSGTYLMVKGNTERTSNYTVVQTASDPVRPGDSVTLQCSVFSDSRNKTFSRDLSVFWFKTASEKSHPDVIYADGNRYDDCEKKSDIQRRCVNRFFKNISSSDDGTYYCAVATCGQLLLGNGSKLEIEHPECSKFILVITIICLVISGIVNIFLICYRLPREACKHCKGIESASSRSRHDNLSQNGDDIAEGGNDLNYAALYFSEAKPKRGRRKKKLNTEESLYSQVKS